MNDETSLDQSALVEWFNECPQPVCVLYRSGRVARINGAAERFLRSNHAVQLREGRLTANEPANRARLQKMLRVTEPVTGLLAFNKYNRPIIADARPLPSGGVVLILRVASCVRISALNDLAQTFNLTTQQRRVAREIIRGKGVDQVAQRMRVSEQTIRTHLKAVFHKIGVHSQAGLISAYARCL